MKRSLLLLFFCLLLIAVLQAAGTPRAYYQKVVSPTVDILTLVSSTVTSSTASNYTVTADIVETTGEVLSTATGTATSSLRLYKAGNGTTTPYYAAVFCQLGTFTTAWHAGQTLRITVTMTNIIPNQSTSWDYVIPTGTAQITITSPTQNIPPLYYSMQYVITPGLNFIALPMDSGLTSVSSISAAYPGLVDMIAYWDSPSASWIASVYLGDMWDNEFTLSPGMPLMINALASFDFYSTGDIPLTPISYSLLEGLNTVMIPLNLTGLSLASQVAASIGNVDQVSKWDPSMQNWVTATNLGGFYDGDFSVTVGMPLFVNATISNTWPVTRSSSNATKSSKASK